MAVIMRCLQQAPHDRFDSVREVAALLDEPAARWAGGGRAAGRARRALGAASGGLTDWS